jgi:Flp pilus assembly protein TadD
VLLDQKRTRRTIQVVSIATSLAFAGVIFVVLGLIFFGGGGDSAADQQVHDAKNLVEKEPKSVDAWESLASAYAGKGDFDKAVGAARRAVALRPDDFSTLQTLISLQIRNKSQGAALDTLQSYTAKNPDNADAFVQMANLADDAGRTDLARLAYQRFLVLAPDDPTAPAVRQRLKQLARGTPAGAATPAP